MGMEFERGCPLGETTSRRRRSMWNGFATVCNPSQAPAVLRPPEHADGARPTLTAGLALAPQFHGHEGRIRKNIFAQFHFDRAHGEPVTHGFLHFFPPHFPPATAAPGRGVRA